MRYLIILLLLLSSCGEEPPKGAVPLETELGTVFLLPETDCLFEKQSIEARYRVVQTEINDKFYEAVTAAPWLSKGKENRWFDGLLIEFRTAPFVCVKKSAVLIPWLSREHTVGQAGVQGCFIWYQNKIVTRCDGKAVGHETAHAMLWNFNVSEDCWKTVEHCPGVTFTCDVNPCD